MNALDQNLNKIRELVSLVEAAQRGDREAFGQLFVRFERVVFAVALRRMKSEVEAEELVQEVFIKAMEKIGQLRGPECFAGWLQSITNRLAINRLVRVKNVVTADVDVMQAVEGDEISPLVGLLDEETRQQIRDGMARLRDMDRAALQAFYMDGQSLNEMCEVFNAPMGTIKRRLHVARKRLADQLLEVA
ncbi:MAG TPA: sigma-70 family RNA polymerase sigma factor [Pirellulaceae bacterium]|nr:sigma-70 family RNA polymerase sigma factor [Pirellulaceae bacterium]HMO93048.1 sigma-70 family RNA polymerase sigma factor [Pirellulaceae bacterium]HMP69678.1 sigma-70 family RNA polymerase sigma factor [Pirellulaceae bacterium]